MSGTVLVVGASGVVGRAALAHFAARPGWRVVGVSRRRPDLDVGTHLAIDLTDRAACERVLGVQKDVTHVVYAALYEKPGLFRGWVEPDQMQTNLAMLRNCMEPLEAAAAGLRHVSVLQGTKAYGAHVRPMRVPGREREPRVPHENFYWLQEDWIRARQAHKRWSFTFWRPPLVIGHAFGAPMNVLAVVGVYAAIRRELGQAFSWPGGACAPIDVVDARLLAAAFEWAANGGEGVNPAAANETFNVTNGDVMVWRNVWGAMARAFGMEEGADEPHSLATTLPELATVWERVVARHALRAPGLREFTGDSLVYADMFFNAGRQSLPPPSFLSTIKLRTAGFHDCLDSEDMLVSWIGELQRIRVLPPP
jgi:nucleoside-diphosphate-sugar epimerase